MKKNTVLHSFFVAVFCFLSCEKEETVHTPICNGTCDAQFIIVYENQEIFPDSNNYHKIPWNGLNYFQVKGQLTEMDEEYHNNGGDPFISTSFDSDYWVVINNLYFQTPQYSYLGWFNNSSLTTPIPFGNYTYTMEDILSLHSPLNIVGYQVPKHFCTECPYAPTLVGYHSRYNYNPTCNVLLDDEMIGDTITIFTKATFNINGGVWYNGDTSPTPIETVETQLKVVII